MGKKGVVRDAAAHEQVLADSIAVVRSCKLVVMGATFSPIKGPEGNIEFWVWCARSADDVRVDPAIVVSEAHESLGGS